MHVEKRTYFNQIIMKSIGINVPEVVSKAHTRDRFLSGEQLKGGIFLALSLGFAVLIGLFIPFLGFQSGSSLLLFLAFLGLLICATIIVYYATQARKWALLSFLVFSVFLVDATFRRREITDQSMDAQTALKLAIWCSAFIIAFFSTRQLGRRLFQGDIKWLTLFSLLALASTGYSLTPAYTFGGGVAAVSYCALAVCVTEHLSRRQILYSLLIGMSVVLAISIVMFFIMGWGTAALEGGTGFRLGGVAGSPNSLGRTASMTILVTAVLVVSYRLPVYSWRCVLPVVMGGVCLILSDSRTSLLAVIAAFGFYLLRCRPVIGLTAIGGMALAGLALLNLDIPWHELGKSFARSGRFSEMTTLTGRTEIWSATWKAFLERPLFGYGYGSTKVLLPEVYRSFWGYTVTQAHNLYLQILVTTGVVGLILILIPLSLQIIAYITRPQPFTGFVIVYMLVYGLTETGPISTAPNILTFIWAISLCWDRASDDSVRDYRKNPLSSRRNMVNAA